MGATIKQVAEYAGVSIGTVSNVLRNAKSVREDSRRRVMEAVEALNYQANPAASVLRSGRSNVIAAVVPNIQNPFFASLLATLERHCGKHGYDLLVSSSNHDEATETARLRSLLNWSPAGLFVIPVSSRLPGRALIEETQIPFFLADRDIKDRDCDFIEIDNVESGRIAGNHLKELGHSNACAFAPDFKIENINQRVKGIRSALGGELRLIEVGHEADRKDLEKIAEEWDPAATAAIGLTNSATLQALGTLRFMKRNVPGEVSLIGFDDYEWMALAAPSITAIKQPVAEMGEVIWNGLQRRLKGGSPLKSHTMLQPQLIVRESTGPSPRHS